MSPCPAGFGQRMISTFATTVRSGRARALACVALVSCLALAAVASAQVSSAPEPATWITDGPVYALAHADGATYVGGDFHHIGRRTGPGAPFGSDNAQLAAPFPEVAGGRVYAVVADSDGGWYIGGDFTHVGGQRRYGLAYITPSGAVGGFAPQLACAFQSTGCDRSSVRALALSSSAPDADTLYVGGTFEKVGNSGRTYLAAFDTGSGTLTNWNPSPNGWVFTLAVTHLELDRAVPVVFAGGDFTVVGGVDRARLAAIWGAGAQDPAGAAIGGTPSAWAPNPAGIVRALALGEPSDPHLVAGQGEKVALNVYAGMDVAGDTFPTPSLSGYRFRVGTADRAATNTVYTSWSPQPKCPAGALGGGVCQVRALALAGSTLYVGGNFTTVGTASPAPARSGIAAVSAIPSPTVDSTPAATVYAWNPSADGPVNALAVGNGSVYAGGDFQTAGGQPRAGTVAVPAPSDATVTAADAGAWDAKLAGGGVDALALQGAQLYAGGRFSAAEAVPAERLAALDSTGAPLPWKARANGPVHALAAAGGVVYAGGGFTQLGDTARNHIGALDAAGDTLAGWAPEANDWVLALATAGDVVYAGGAFSAIGGEQRAHAAALRAAGAEAAGTATAWRADANESVRAIAASCDTVYLGGSFTQLAGAERARIGAVTSGGTLTAWNPGAEGTVHALAGTSDVLYAGGGFAYAGGATRHRIAALDRISGLATSWSPVATGTVRTLAVAGDGSTVYAGGSFASIGGAARERLAALDAGSGAATGWDPGTDGPVYALELAGGTLWTGGDFARVAAAPARGIAAFGAAPAGAAPFDCPATSQRSSGSPGPADGDGQAVAGVQLAAPAVLPTLADTAAPLIRRFAAAARRMRRKLAFRATVSEAGLARVVVARRVRGVLDRGACRRATARRHGRPCTRFQTVLRFDQRVRAGRNVLRVNRRARLAPGRYLATLRVTDAAGNVSRAARVRFEVVR